MIICYVLSLRGPEGFMLDLHGLWIYLLKGCDDLDCPFVVVPLLGRFKGEEHHWQHLLVAVAVTNSGLQLRKWLDALVILQECQGWVQGSAICDEEGFVTKQAEMNAALLSCLESVHKEQPNLFPPDVSVSDYNVDHSFCRGSDSRAKALGIALDDINAVHRWRKVEKARGGQPAQSMSDSYADVKLTCPQFMQYAQPL
jgi:hypothetical protein